MPNSNSIDKEEELGNHFKKCWKLYKPSLRS